MVSLMGLFRETLFRLYAVPAGPFGRPLQAVLQPETEWPNRTPNRAVKQQSLSLMLRLMKANCTVTGEQKVEMENRKTFAHPFPQFSCCLNYTVRPCIERNANFGLFCSSRQATQSGTHVPTGEPRTSTEIIWRS